MNRDMISVLVAVIMMQLGCESAPKKANSSQKVESLAPVVEKNIRAVPFEARLPAEGTSFKTRVLVFRAPSDPVKVPNQWIEKAEGELWRQIERAGVYVLLKPTDIALDTKDLMDRERWDWIKVQKAAREKSIPMVMEWELRPILVEQDSDPVGIIREQRRTVTVKITARLMDSRKGIEIASEQGLAVLEDKNILWLSRSETKATVGDFDVRQLESLLKEAIENLVSPLLTHAKRVAWIGRVALIKGDRIYINVGRQSGLQVGDLLKVLENGDEVFDPETGDSIGKIPGRMKGTLEIISYFGQDGAVAVVHSGAGFSENDTIEYY